VIQYGIGRLLFKGAQIMDELVILTFSLEGKVKPVANWDDVLIINNILNFLKDYSQSIDERVLSASFKIFITSIIFSAIGTWLLSAVFGPKSCTLDFPSPDSACRGWAANASPSCCVSFLAYRLENYHTKMVPPPIMPINSFGIMGYPVFAPSGALLSWSSPTRGLQAPCVRSAKR
jgi:hypothetical protein